MAKDLNSRSLDRTLNDPEVQMWLEGNKAVFELYLAIYAQKTPKRKKKA